MAGWSFGCLTIWSYIRKFGIGNIRALVFISQSPRTLTLSLTDSPTGALDEVASKYRAQILSNGDPRQFIQQYIMQSLVQRTLTDGEIAWMMGESGKTPLEIIASLFASGMFCNYHSEAERADAMLPVMNFIPEHLAKDGAPFFAANFPNSRTFTLGGGMMFWEHAEIFNRELDGFLNTL